MTPQEAFVTALLSVLALCKPWPASAGSYSALEPHKVHAVPKTEAGLVWNGAVTWDSQHGWVFMATHSACFWNRCGVFEQDPRPYVGLLGHGPQPRLTESAFQAGVWDFDEDSFLEKAYAERNTSYTRVDFRPFVYKTKVLAGFSLRKSGPLNGIEYASIAELDVEAKLVRLFHMFDKPLLGDWLDTEKNWGFFQHGDDLIIAYSILPCTRLYRYDPFEMAHAVLMFEKCYHESGSWMQNATLLTMESAHNSAHPVVWNNGNRTEYLLMVHNRHTHVVGGYNHWLLRMDYETLELTHVSKGIVFGSLQYRTSGYVEDAITVGSISVIMHHLLAIVGGDGDEFVVYEHVDLDKVNWLTLS